MNALVRQHLLPLNSTPLERAVSETLDRTPELAQGTEALHAFKYRLPNNSILPWLVQEYGLGPITPYFGSLADVIAHGIPWSRQKGTPKAIEQALDWLRYAYTTLDEAPTRRRRWHLFALELDRFWDRESDLDIIEAVGRLSQPARSEFFRGWHGYAWNLERPQRVDEAIRSIATVAFGVGDDPFATTTGRVQNVRYAVARRAAETRLVTAQDLAEVRRRASARAPREG